MSSPAPSRALGEGGWRQSNPHVRNFSVPGEDLVQQQGGRGSLRFSASPVETGGSLVRDVQLGTPTSAPAHPHHHMEEAAAAVSAAKAGLSRQGSAEGPPMIGNLCVPMPAPPKRVQSVATFKALHTMAAMQPIPPKPAAPDTQEWLLDNVAESQRVQNAWWRTWSLHNRKNSALKDVTFAHSDSPGDTLRISSDALSVEGMMDKTSRPKIWEEFYNIFLERLASNDGASFLAQLADKGHSRSTSSLDTSHSLDGGLMLEGAGVEGGASSSSHGGSRGAGGRGGGGGLMLDESVHGANLFAAMFRSDPNATLPTPSSSSEDFSNFTLPWDPHPRGTAGSRGAAGGLAGLGGDIVGSTPTNLPPLSPSLGAGGRGAKLERSSKSKPMQIPKGPTTSTNVDGEESEDSVGGPGSSSSSLGSKPPRMPPSLEHASHSSGSAVETILKKAFTAVHNSHKFGHDSASPYLGDDLSVHQNSIFGGHGHGFGSSSSLSLSGSGSSSLRLRHSPSSSVVGLNAFASKSRSDLLKYGGVGSLDIDGSGSGISGLAGVGLAGSLMAAPQPSRTPGTRSPVLQRICSCSHWKRTEQHWLLPAVMAMCNDEVLASSTTGVSLLTHALGAYGDLEADKTVDVTMQVDPEAEAYPLPPLQYDPFQTYVLGEVLVCSPSLLGHSDFRVLPTKWEPRLLVVKQNYILEYLPGEPKRPIGFLHLQGSSVSARLDHKNVIHLITQTEMALMTTTSTATTMPSTSPPQASAMPSAASSSPYQTTLIQARSPGQIARWARLFEMASNVSTEDLFEYVPIKAGTGDVTGTAALKAAELGRGRFAVVRKAKRRRYSNMHGESSKEEGHHHQSSSGDEAVCALKVVNKHAFWTRVADGKERHDTLVREILGQGILTAQGEGGAMGADCPIVRLFSVFETQESVVLELELMSRNDLFDELSTAGVLKEHKTAAIVYQVVLAVNFCRQHNIAHRDVKLSNIIFPLENSNSPATTSSNSSSSSSTSSNSSSSTPRHHSTKVKLADFGMAGFFGNKDVTLRGRCGTPGYVAPEILCAGVNEGYGNNVDIFSVGVVAYTLLCGYEPFYGVTDKQLIAANKLAEYEFHEPEWTRISHEAKDLVSKMLLRDPEKRITPADALEHPWIKRFQQEGGSSSTGAGGPLASAKDGVIAGSSSGGAGRPAQSDRALDKAARLSSSLRSQYASPPCCVM